MRPNEPSVTRCKQLRESSAEATKQSPSENARRLLYFELMLCLLFQRLNDRKTHGAPLCFALVIVLLLGVGIPAVAQREPSLPSKDEGRALVERSNNLTNLRALGSPPFHLRARTVSYGRKGQTNHGKYDLWWASPDRWREDISWGDKSSTRIADKNQIWVSGADASRLTTLHVARVFDFSPFLRVPLNHSVGRVQAKQIDGVSAVCMQLLPSSSGTAYAKGIGPMVLSLDLERSACWDVATSLPLRIDVGSDRIELESYSAIAQKQFPHRIHETRKGKTLVEFELDSLELLDVATTTAFTPPSGTSAKPWCANIVSPVPLRLGSASEATSAPGVTFMTPIPKEVIGRDLVVFRVDEAGRTVEVRAFTLAGEDSFKDRETQTLLKSRFKPATCDGTPVEGEFLMLRQEPSLAGELHPTGG